MVNLHGHARLQSVTVVGLLLLALLGHGCGKSAGTYVHVQFGGTTSTLASIARLDLEVSLAGKTTSTFFTSTKPITLPTDATLEIGTGEGTIVIIASARAANGQLLGKGQGTNSVKRGSVVVVKVTLAPASESGDGGTYPDLGIFDSRPSLDTWPLTGGAVSDAGRDGPSGGGAIGGTGGQGGTGGSSTSANLVVTPEKLDLGTAAIGSKTQPQSITLANRGTKETGTLSFNLQNPELFPFDNNPCSTVDLLPGSSCTFSMFFKPATPGPSTSTLKISAPGISPVEIPLSGIGVGAGTASLNLSPLSKNYGVVDINGPGVSELFTVTNTGSLSMGPVNVLFEANTPFFKIENDQCRTQHLSPGKSCTFSVSFVPTAVGPAHVNLMVQAEPGASVTTPLSGTGRKMFNVVVDIIGNGKGNVKAPGLLCTDKTCTTTVEWTQPTAPPQITLEAIPETGSIFGGYGGGPCANEPRCTINLTADVHLTAKFNANPSQLVQFGLNIISLAGHQGVLVVNDGTQSSVCESSSCGPETRQVSPSITIIAKPKNTSTFAAWTDGPCKGTNPTCTFALTTDTFISATFGPQSYVFTTSTVMVPNGFGGPKGADAECQRLANKASLPGKYRAWMSSMTEPARTRVGNGGWVRTDGRPFARSLAALLDTTNPAVYYPARLDESGQDLGSKSQWVATGSDADGNPAITNCQDFSGTVGEINLGDTAMGSRAWSYREPKGSCTSRYRLLCFRLDTSESEIKPPALPGRRLFVTKGPFIPGGGSNAADEACQAEAKAANLADSYIAFISTDGFSARSRITPGRPWKRLDEVFVARTPDDFANGNLLAPVGVAANGVTYLIANMWTGSKNPAQIAALDTSCQSFKSSLPTVQSFVGMSHSTVFPEWFTSTTVSCANPSTHLLCIEP